MPEPISVISSVGSVIGTSAKILQLFHRISQQYAGSELYMAQATAECSTVRLALVQLQESLESRYTLGASSETRGEVLASVEAVTMVCALSLSKLEEYVTTSVKALPEAEDEESLKHLGKRQKLKIAWNHDEIGHHLQQLRGCQSSLTLLLGVLHCRSTAKMCSLLAETRATLERVHLAIRYAGFDGVSLSGMTLQIEEAFEIVQPGKMISDSSGLSRHDGQETRVHELVDSSDDDDDDDDISNVNWRVDSSEPQEGSQHLLQAQADDLVDTTPDTQLAVAAKEPGKTVSAPGTKEPQSGTRRPFVVNIFQNIRIMVSPKPPPRPKEPARIEEYTGAESKEPARIEEYTGLGWNDTVRTITVVGSKVDPVMSALRPLFRKQGGIRLTYRYHGQPVTVYVISNEDRFDKLNSLLDVEETDLFMKYVGPDTSGEPSNLDGCRNWRLMKVNKPLYHCQWWRDVEEGSADFRTPDCIDFNTIYHRAEDSGNLTPLEWRQPTTKSTEGIRAMVMQAMGLLLDSEDRKTRRARFGGP